MVVTCGCVACTARVLKTLFALSVVESKDKCRHSTQRQSLCASCFNVQDRRELGKIPTMSRRGKFSSWLTQSTRWLTPCITWTRIFVLTTGASVPRWSKLGARSCWSTSATLISMVSLQAHVVFRSPVLAFCFISYMLNDYLLLSMCQNMVDDLILKIESIYEWVSSEWTSE